MKYMGSKARLSKDIVPILQDIIDKNKIKTYIEPFVGGANTIDKIKCENKIGLDNNKYLISLWQKLQSGYVIPKSLTKEEYDKIKENKDNYPEELVAIAGILATYNAKWFGGYAKITKTKIGTTRNYYDESKRNVEKQINNLNDVEFICSDYKSLLNKKIKDSLIYCDPPYEGTTKYGDNEFNHKEYWDFVREMSKDNIVICSEYNAPEDFECIFEKQLTTTMDNASRKKDTEKLFKLK